MIDFVLNRPRLVPGRLEPERGPRAIGGLDDDRQRPLDVAEDLRDRETPFFGGLRLLPPVYDRRVHEHERLGRVASRVDDSDASRDPDLIGGESHPFGGVHRFEQIVDQLPHRVIHSGNGLGALPQDGRTEQVEFADAHAGLAGAAAGAAGAASRFVIDAMLLRRITSFASPLLIVTSASFRYTTSPTIPPEVTMRSPFCKEASSFSCASRWRRCGRMMKK